MAKTVSTISQSKAGRAYVPASVKRKTTPGTMVVGGELENITIPDELWRAVKATTIDLPAIDQHGLVQFGVPTEVFDKVVASFVHLDEAEVLGAVGVSSRTVQRRKSGVLSSEHSGAMLDLIAVTQKAMDVLGSREAAENWLHQPAIAFDGRRPIELLSTRPGSEMVKEHLVRMDYGVYA